MEAVSRSRYELALRLFGAAGRLRQHLNATVLAPLQAAQQAAQATCRDCLGPEGYEAAWNEGHRWSTDTAVDYALNVENIP